MDKKYRQLPNIVHTWLQDQPAYLTGSAAEWYTGNADEPPRDYDILITGRDDFNAALRSLPENTDVRVNSMGGVKVYFSDKDLELDVWPQTIEEYFSQANRKGYEDVTILTLDPKLTITSK